MNRKRIFGPLPAALLMVLAMAGMAVAKEPKGLQQGDGEVIDITGFMEWPKGDSRLPWGRPETFRSDSDLVFGLMLKDEVFHPVDRDSLKRTMAVQRVMGRSDQSDRPDR